VLVFFVFEAAGAIDECADGSEEGCGLVQEFELDGAKAGDFFGCYPTAEVNAAAHDAGVRAGGVEENLIEVRGGRREWRGRRCNTRRGGDTAPYLGL
jgi:esterase/lipase superfamily enzyme